MGTYGISSLGGTITGGGGGSGRAGVRTEYPSTYVPNCVTNDGLILNREDHLEVLLHVRYPERGIARDTRYFTPGPSGMWGSGRYAQNFRGMVRRAPISLADFKNWIARQVPSMFPGATLIAPDVCVKTVWRGDHTRIDAPPYEPPAAPPSPAADTGPLPAHIPLDTGSGWSIVGDRPSTAGTSRPLPAWAGGLLFGGGAGTPGGPGVDAGGGESACSGGGGVTAPPGTDATGEDVAAPPGTDSTSDTSGDEEAPPEEAVSSPLTAWYQEHKGTVLVVASLAATAAILFGAFKFGKAKAPKKNRRRNRRR